MVQGTLWVMSSSGTDIEGDPNDKLKSDINSAVRLRECA